MANNNSMYIGNVNPSGRGMNGAVYDSFGASPILITNEGKEIKAGSYAPPPISYCIDANYYKGTTIEQYIRKKRRQLVMSNFRVRKLTPKECWKLMGFEPSDYEKARDAMNQNIYNGKDRSGSQLYKQAGNSIVVDVLLHIMENLYDAMPYLFDDMQIGSFFSGIGAFEKALTRLDSDHPGIMGEANDLELRQIGYINDYNGDANRIYDGSTVSRALKAEAGGVARRPVGTQSGKD